PAEWQPLLDLVSDVYEHADTDRALLERALDLTSQELLERNRQLTAAHARIDVDYAQLTADLQLAQQIQRQLIPTGAHTLQQLHYYSSYHPASAVGGDYFDCLTGPGGRVVLLIGDATGKGAAAAMLMAAVKSAALTVVAHQGDPAGLLRHLNTRVRSLGTQGMTLCALSLAAGTRSLQIANAGHLYPYLLGPGAPPRLIDLDSGLPLGSVGSPGYQATSRLLQPGDRLVLYTDGLVEATDAHGRMFGFERLEALLAARGAAPAPELSGQLLEAVARHQGPTPPQDDITLVIVDILAAE
ncbi:MAG TPA: SpoIIE family protein phosphatase, partial [Chloroflexia bacterium]|nr:SpoIIE family protein phosphatase [Chloroflexia bacterium]